MPRSPRHVYVHVPFCARRCAYCDFAIAVRSRVPVDEYVAALRRELTARVAPADGPDRTAIDTLYFGGGTPSRLGPAGVANAVSLLRERFDWPASAEVTLEANPDDVDVASVRTWRDAGINRVSLGGQTFDPRALAWMHRTHDVAQIGRAVDALVAGGIDDYSIDLIFALPDGVEREWAADVRAALELAPTHLSLYGLTVEAGTPLGRWADRGAVREADEDRYADEFLHAHHALTEAGFEHYEVSNFARPGRRARHNSSYWRGVPYLGLGPSAHGFDGRERRWNEREYARWVDATRSGDPIGGRESLDDGARIAETVYLGLRTTDGLALDAREAAHAERWIDAGWAHVEDGVLRLSPLGWLRLDALAADLTARRSHS